MAGSVLVQAPFLPRSGMVIWIHSLPEQDAQWTRSLTDLLCSRQIETKEYDWSPLPTPGVLLASRCDDSVCGFVRGTSCFGGARILVLVRERTLLTGGAAWELLRAGASDVMVWEGTPEVVDDVVGRFERWNAVDEILDSTVVKGNLIGKGTAWTHVLRDIIEIAKFSSASGGLLGTVSGTAIAPGVPGSAIDATMVANRTFSSGFAQGQLSCASTESNPATCLPPIAITAVPDGKVHAPYFMEWSFGLEHQFGPTASIHAQYVGTRAVNQPYLTQVNGYQTVCEGCFAPFPYAQPTDPRFGAVTQFSTGANSHYNGL
jgi:hypothetical protein